MPFSRINSISDLEYLPKFNKAIQQRYNKNAVGITIYHSYSDLNKLEIVFDFRIVKRENIKLIKRLPFCILKDNCAKTANLVSFVDEAREELEQNFFEKAHFSVFE